MSFGITRLFKANDPQKLIDANNDHLDKYNRKNAYIAKSITRPNIFLLASRYEDLSEKEEQEEENRSEGLVNKSGGGEFIDIQLVKVLNNNNEGKGVALSTNAYLSVFGGQNNNVRKTTELNKIISDLDGKSLLKKGISQFQTTGITGMPMNQVYVWHAIDSYETANKVLQDGIGVFHSDDSLRIIQEVLPLWQVKNRGFFKTVRNMG